MFEKNNVFYIFLFIKIVKKWAGFTAGSRCYRNIAAENLRWTAILPFTAVNFLENFQA